MTKMKYVILILILTLTGCDNSSHHSETLNFDIEPQFGRVFFPTRILHSGERIKIEYITIKESERIRFHLCGPKCNSATEIKPFNIYHLIQSKFKVFKAKEDGEYYFWLEDSRKTGTDSAVPISKHEINGSIHTFIFESGSKIKVF